MSAGTGTPPEMHEGRDGWKEIVRLINWLRRRVIELTGGGSGTGTGSPIARRSYDLGNDLLSGPTGVETILWQRPVTYAVYPASSISVMLEAWARSFGGSCTFNLRLGGTSRTPTDGVIIASVTLPFSVDPNYAPVSMAATISKLSGQDYLKLTCIAGSGDARIAEGGVTLT